MYGEAATDPQGASEGQGLSPRVRGSLYVRRGALNDVRTIPTPTGKPGPASVSASEAGDYPRAYGEAAPRWCSGPGSPTLSPRLRGSRRAIIYDDFPVGTIPAPTGKPLRTTMACCPTRVYPRAYGEAGFMVSWRAFHVGLSPRLRGSLTTDPDRFPCARSIPAPTGKPLLRGPRPRASWVYPRAYGEAASGSGITYSLTGLSPRLRGSHRRHQCLHSRNGSIPAPTGKPTATGDLSFMSWVYPRAYGEARPSWYVVILRRGLSPRLRGSRTREVGGRVVAGSIPAPTGKPQTKAMTPLTPQVYPRAYGEAKVRTEGHLLGRGLSPRLRGSQ